MDLMLVFVRPAEGPRTSSRGLPVLVGVQVRWTKPHFRPLDLCIFFESKALVLHINFNF